MRKKVFASRVFLCVCASVGSASAYELLMCGTTHLGIESDVQWRLDRCTIAAGSAEETDFQAAEFAWNSVHGVLDRFSDTGGNTNCSANLQGNGQFDVQMKSSLGGAAALAWYTGMAAGNCTDGEWDVLFTPNLTAGPPPETTPAQTFNRRLIFAHELGHVLGMAHELTQNRVATMAPYNPFAPLGGQTALRGGVFGDDVAYARAYHGSSQTSYDLGVSAWKRNGGAHILPSLGFQWGCTGQTASYTATWTNKGTKAITQADNVKLKVYLSSDTIISSADTLVQTWKIYIGVGGSSTWSSSFAIPSSLPLYQSYYIGIVADADGTLAEIHEGNNATPLDGGVMRHEICR